MADVVICRQLKDRGFMTDEEHKLVSVTLVKWAFKNRFVQPMAQFYLSSGPELVRKMNAANADWSLLVPANNEVLRLIKAGDMTKAAIIYGQDIVCASMERYWPDCKDPFYFYAKRTFEEAKERVANGQNLVGVPQTKT